MKLLHWIAASFFIAALILYIFSDYSGVWMLAMLGFLIESSAWLISFLSSDKNSSKKSNKD